MHPITNEMPEPGFAIDALERQRLTWELGLLNEIAAIVASSLELDVSMQRAAERIADGFKAEFVYVRVKPIDGGDARVVASVGASRDEIESAFAEGNGGWLSEHEHRIV